MNGGIRKENERDEASVSRLQKVERNEGKREKQRTTKIRYRGKKLRKKGRIQERKRLRKKKWTRKNNNDQIMKKEVKKKHE